MSWIRLIVFALPVMLISCSSANKNGTIAQLRNMSIEIKEEKIEGGLEKAMASYQRFLEETPDSALSAEAIRRLADLKIEKEYGLVNGGDSVMPAPEPAPRPVVAPSKQGAVATAAAKESEADFERRSTSSEPMASAAAESDALPEGADDLEKAGPLEAIKLYQKLLDKFPLYERNDQVLYQMSRAYEELGRTKDAMKVMNRLVRDFPHSRYIDEVQFRRGEYFFTRRKYLDAEDAYKNIVDIGVGSFYYQLALFKLGWTFYKQDLNEEALDRFIALLDYKVSVGYDFAQSEDENERKKMEDTLRVISLGFSNLGGADSVVKYFSRHGKRSYEDRIYSNLGEYYVTKRRYSDASATYNAFVSRNPYHKRAPSFHMRVIEINIAGGFPSLVIDSKKAFATNYGLKGEYWQYFEPSARPEVLADLKTNLKDLANHYHALYQDKRRAKDKTVNLTEALHWYREFIVSFPKDIETAAINYQLADLLLENLSFAEAAVEYEKTAYDYTRHEKASTAGYAAVYAYRKHLGVVPETDQYPVKLEVVRSSLKFAENFPEHDKAAIVLGAAVDDLYDMKDYKQALAAAQKLIEGFPGADKDVLRAAWLVVGHSSFELHLYSESEAAYVEVLALLPEGDKTRKGLIDNLAVSIYKQGEQAKELEDYRAAADHFLRVGLMAPTSKFRPTAEYDAAAALIELKDWKMAATVLSGFRNTFAGHELQADVTKKIAYVYRQDGQLSLAANEYERIERESQDEEVRREALLVAAGLHEEVGDSSRAIKVFQRYVGYFPQPVELNLETRSKIAEILKSQNDQKNYLEELRKIVAIELSAGKARTDRTRYIAGKAALVLTEPIFGQFVEVRLVKPFEANLRKKKKLMKEATKKFGKLIDYEVGEVTAAVTFYLAEIYANFSTTLMESERPVGLSPLELEQYEMAIEEQAYPFEDRAIEVHKSNLELISLGVYNIWIDKSLQKLAVSVPARYAKPEKENDIIASLDTFVFAIDRPQPPAPPEPEEGTEAATAEPALPGPEEGTEAATAEIAPPGPEEGTGAATPEPASPGPEEGIEAATPEPAPPGPEEGIEAATAEPAPPEPEEEAGAATAEPAPPEPEDEAGAATPEPTPPGPEEEAEAATAEPALPGPEEEAEAATPEPTPPGPEEGTEAATPEPASPEPEEGTEAATAEPALPGPEEGTEAATAEPALPGPEEEAEAATPEPTPPGPEEGT
ncbi:MAG: tetratricopeptide repeat protein, partial [Verrucomicrobiota bacterium]